MKMNLGNTLNKPRQEIQSNKSDPGNSFLGGHLDFAAIQQKFSWEKEENRHGMFTIEEAIDSKPKQPRSMVPEISEFKKRLMVMNRKLIEFDNVDGNDNQILDKYVEHNSTLDELLKVFLVRQIERGENQTEVRNGLGGQAPEPVPVTSPRFYGAQSPAGVKSPSFSPKKTLGSPLGPQSFKHNQSFQPKSELSSKKISPVKQKSELSSEKISPVKQKSELSSEKISPVKQKVRFHSPEWMHFQLDLSKLPSEEKPQEFNNLVQKIELNSPSPSGNRLLTVPESSEKKSKFNRAKELYEILTSSETLDQPNKPILAGESDNLGTDSIPRWTSESGNPSMPSRLNTSQSPSNDKS
jgi:hypothetical protein